MKNKLMSISIILMLIFTSLISVEALAPTPRIDLDEYQLEATDVNNVYVTGTVTLAKGQLIGVYDSTGTLLYNFTQVANSNDEEDFKIQIPAIYLKSGTNTFKVKSIALKGYINGSNPKTVTVKVKTPSKQDQTITASDLTLKVGETKNLNAKVDSGLTLTYSSDDASIATVDAKGNVIGRSKGTTKVTIKQAGNDKYNGTSKVVKITVKDSTTPTPTPSNDEITTKFDSYQFNKVDISKSIGAKSKRGGTLVYSSSNSKVASVDSTGKVTAKKQGTAIIKVSLKDNKSVYKNVTFYVPKTPNDRQAALKPWYTAMENQKTAQNKRPAVYSWTGWANSGYSLKGSEKYGTCITFPSASLQRAGLLSKGEYVTPQNGTNFNASLKKKSIKFLKRHPGYFTWFNHSASLKSGVKSGKILPGDIIHYKYHTLVYWGKYKGNLCISEAGRWKSKTYSYAHTKVKTSGKTYVGWVNRISCYNINTYCTNGKITDTNLYMAGQNIKITYSPAKGKKIKSITVDGKTVSTSKNKTSYTFKKLNKNHTIEVVFD